MKRNCFFLNFQLIGNNVQVFLCGCLFLSLLLYNRCLVDFKLLSTLRFTVVQYVGLHTLLNFFFSWCDFLLLPFFFNINLCGSTLLGFLVGHRTTSVKTTLSNRLVVWIESTWIGVNWSGRLIREWSLYSEFDDKWLLFISSSLKCNRDDLNLVNLR